MRDLIKEINKIINEEDGFRISMDNNLSEASDKLKNTINSYIFSGEETLVHQFLSELGGFMENNPPDIFEDSEGDEGWQDDYIDLNDKIYSLSNQKEDEKDVTSISKRLITDEKLENLVSNNSITAILDAVSWGLSDKGDDYSISSDEIDELIELSKKLEI